MNNIWAMVKIHFIGVLGINKALYVKDPKERVKAISIGILIGFSGVSVIGVWLAYCIGMQISFMQMGYEEGVLALVFGLASILCLITTIYKGSSILFNSEDFNIIMPLPIKDSDIIIAKLLNLYIMNVFFTLGVMLPAYGVFVWYTSPKWLFYLYGMIGIFITPIFPIVIGTALSIMVSVFSNRFKHKNLLTIVLSVLLFASIMVVSFSAGSMTEEAMMDIGKGVMMSINKMYPLTQLFIEGVYQQSFIAFCIFLGVSFITFGVFVKIISLKFRWAHTLINSTSSGSVYEMQQLRYSSPLFALYKRELRRYFASPTYVINTMVGVIMLLLVAVVMVVKKQDIVGLMYSVPEMKLWTPIVTPLFVAVMIMMANTTAVSISMEGKGLSLIKAYPIKPMDFFMAKVFLNLTMTLPVALISSLVVGVVLELTIVEVIYSLVIVAGYALLSGTFGIIVNLLLPKLEWDNEVVVVKQSSSTTVGMFGGIILVLASGALVFLVTSANTHMLLFGMVIIVCLLNIMMLLVLKEWGSKVFNQL